MKTRNFIAAATLGLTTLGAAPAYAESGWEYQATIYGWLPDIGGSLNYDVPPGSGGGDIGVDAGTILDNLKMTFMGTVEGRKDKWSFFTDLLYLRLGNAQDTTVKFNPGPGQGIELFDVRANIDLKAWVITGAIGYEVHRSEQSNMDVFGGLRYLSLDTDARISRDTPFPPPLPDERSVEVSQSEDLLDAIVGVRGQLQLNDRWFIPYYADVGAGSSKLTWQALAGIGYRFDWGDVKLAYRHLEYDQGSDKLLQNVNFSGPALGVGFKF